MAFPWAAAAAIADVVANLLTSRQNRRDQKKQNEADRKFQMDQLMLQRGWAVEDWNKQNQYNSPLQQMQRLREAGLNPNLVYGSGADNTASMIRSTEAKDFKQPAPQFSPIPGIQNAIMQYQQIKQSQEATDNLAVQRQLMEKEIMLKDAQTSKTISETATTDFQRAQAMRLQDSVIKKANLENTQLETNIKYQSDLNKRENEKQQYVVQQMVENVYKTRLEQLQIKASTAKTIAEHEKINQEIQNLQVAYESGIINNEIMKEQERLWKQGINPNDPIIYRQLGKFLDNLIKLYEEW